MIPFEYESGEKKGAKQGLSAKAGAQRRERHLQQVRHQAAGDALRQLRRQEINEDGEGNEVGEEMIPTGPLDVWAYDKTSPPHSIPLALLGESVQLAQQGQTPKDVFQGVLLIRKMLSVESNVPYTQVVSSGIVPRLVELLDRFDVPDLQFECAWAVTNLSADTNPSSSDLALSCGVAARLVALLKSPNFDCVDQGCWALGNLAANNATCRYRCLDAGAMPGVLEVLMTPDVPIGITRNAVWTASNLCRGRPHPKLEQVGMAAPVLARFLSHNDSTVVVDAAWGLSYLSDGPAERVQLVVEANVLPRVIELMSGPAGALKTPAIRIIGNLASGEDSHRQTLIDAGALPYFNELLRHPKRAIRKEVCWTISNISAGPPEQIDALIQAGVFPPLLDCLAAPELDVKKEAVWAIANAAFCGTRQQTKWIISHGVIPPLCETLRVYDVKIATVALEALQVMTQYIKDELNWGMTNENVEETEITNCSGVEKKEQLQNPRDRAVYELALSILEGYFIGEDDEVRGEKGRMIGDILAEGNDGNMNTGEMIQQNQFSF